MYNLIRCLIEKTLIGITRRRSLSIAFQVSGQCSGSPLTSDAGERPPSNGAESLSVLNPKYTFDSFIVGNCNRLAHAAALAAAQSPGHSYNPLFICSESGLGKTHLLQAIGQRAQANNIKLLYVSAEQFTNDFITAIKGNHLRIVTYISN